MSESERMQAAFENLKESSDSHSDITAKWQAEALETMKTSVERTSGDIDGLLKQVELVDGGNKTLSPDNIPGLDSKNNDWEEPREPKQTKHSDGSVTYHTRGEVEDSGIMPWNWGDTNFNKDVTVDKDGKFKEAVVKYESSIGPLTFGGGIYEDGCVRIPKVDELKITKNDDGTYTLQFKPPGTYPHRFNTVKFDQNGKLAADAGSYEDCNW